MFTTHLHYACQVHRGAGSLPHVGSHPGWPVFLLLTGIAATFGLQTLSLTGFALHLGAVSIFNLPVLVFSSISRAELNDRLERRARVNAIIDAWVNTNGEQPGTTISIGLRWIGGRRGYLRAFRDDWPYTPQLPAEVTSQLEMELTRSMTGVGRHIPSADELQPRRARIRALNAHERVKALGVIGGTFTQAMA